MPNGINTRRDLVDNVLYELGLVGAGQSPAAEDVAAVDRYVEPTIARLTALEILGDFDVDQVPDEFFTPLAILIGDSLLGQYGIPRGNEDDPNSWASKLGNARQEMRQMRAARPTYAPLKTEYF